MVGHQRLNGNGYFMVNNLKCLRYSPFLQGNLKVLKCTQLTLNSVEWNTEILLDNDGKITKIKIGEFIDKIVHETLPQDKIEMHPNDTRLGWIDDKNIKVLSCDEDGKISWKLIEAVTKHPPINEDGSNTLVKVITKSGREVIATKAKSFLKRENNKIVPVRGDELNVGDHLPVSNVLPFNNFLESWDISQYVSKKEFVYMSEVQKALSIYTNKENRYWFKKNNGKTFTIPYTRSDGFIDAFVGIGKNKEIGGRRNNLLQWKDNCVYPKNMIIQPADVPENIKMDNLFGFFVGAYLAEGNCTKHAVMIANIDDQFNHRIDEFCKCYNLNYHIQEKKNEKGHSKTLRIHSIVLARLFSKALGACSYEKKLPSEFLAANDDFIRGLIDGYMSGDGCVDKKLNALSVTSVSYALITDIQQLLVRYHIQTTITECHTGLRIALNKGFNAHLAYKLQLNATNTYKFKNTFTLTLQGKQERLNKREQACNLNFIDIIPNVMTSQFGNINIARADINNYLNKCKNKTDIDILNKVLQEEIIYDEIIKIEEIVSEHPYVYDLTVQDTRNFNIYNGLCIRDTFHLSGVSSASKAVRGVPRIKELLSVTKNIKAPSMSIYLDDQHNKEKMKCKEILNTIETTHFKDIVTSTKIYYDPNDFETTIDEDRLFLATYKEMIAAEKLQLDKLSPWLLRMEFDKEKMMEYEISMIDIYHVLHDWYDGSISAMFSDDNAKKLVFRIKVYEEDEVDEERDVITELKALEKNILENRIIKGIDRVNKVSMMKKEYLEYQDETMTFEKAYEWILETNGTNLVEILGHRNVDKKRTVSNNINEIYELLGIEAARQALYNELNDVITDADLYVNYRHLALLVDTMTCKGYLLSIDRHGINRVDIGPLAKSSFEETTDMLIKAGIFSEVDKINGVSANIMLGQIPPCGTGDSEIMIDETKLMELFANMAKELPEDDYLETIEEDLDEMCDIDNLTFDFIPPEKDTSIIKKIVDLKIK